MQGAAEQLYNRSVYRCSDQDIILSDFSSKVIVQMPAEPVNFKQAWY